MPLANIQRPGFRFAYARGVRALDRLRNLDQRVLGRTRKPTLRSDLVTNLVVTVVFVAIGVVVIVTGHGSAGWGVIGVALAGYVVRSIGDLTRPR